MVGVEVGVSVEVEVGVEVLVGIGVNVGPNNLPGPQDAIGMLIKTQIIAIVNRLIFPPVFIS